MKTTAVEWMRRACEKGDVGAEIYLITMLDKIREEEGVVDKLKSNIQEELINFFYM